MEFTAPEMVSHYATLYPSIFVSVWVVLLLIVIVSSLATKWLSIEGFVALLFVLFTGAAFLGLFSSTVGKSKDYSIYQQSVATALNENNDRVSLSKNSSFPVQEESVRDVDLIINDGGILNCQTVKVNDVYTVTCKDPSSNGRMVSVDEALTANDTAKQN